MNSPEHSSSAGQRQDPGSRQTSALDWVQRTGMAPEVLAELATLERRRHRRRAVIFPLAMATAMFAIILMVWHRPASAPPPGKARGQLVVQPPEHRTLTDGSIVELKDGAQLSVAFTREIRGVTLKRGTAHFQVAQNPERPFVVTAGGITVRAVGTAFSVDVAREAVEVLVTEGQVAVASESPEAPADMEADAAAGPAMVGAGERVLVDAPSIRHRSGFTVVPVRADELALKMAWRMPRLEFSGTPLSEVIAMFNRYNTRQLVLADASLSHFQLSGNLRADKIQGLLELLEQSFHIQAEYRGDREIVLRRQAPAAGQ